MNFNRKIATLVTTTLVITATAADPISSRAAGDDFAYRSGGIGQAEAQEMRAARKDYSLGLTFATREGAFLADVNVEVRNASGEVVLTKQGQGPMVLADLPPGRYTVHATANGRTQTHEVSVPRSGHEQITLSW